MRLPALKLVAPVVTRCGNALTDVSLLCYNSITEQGQMFWGVRSLSSMLNPTLFGVHGVQNPFGVHGVHKLRNSGIRNGKRLTAANRLTARKASKHTGLLLT